MGFVSAAASVKRTDFTLEPLDPDGLLCFFACGLLDFFKLEARGAGQWRALVTLGELELLPKLLTDGDRERDFCCCLPLAPLVGLRECDLCFDEPFPWFAGVWTRCWTLDVAVAATCTPKSFEVAGSALNM